MASTRALVIVTNYGVEQDELVVPVDHLRASGADVTIATAESGSIQTLIDDKDPGQTVESTALIADVAATDFDMLLVPGGTINADTLRQNADAVALVKAFAEAGKPIAAICHGPWALVEADVVRGKTLTSFPSLQTDIRNAGAAQWIDEEVVSDDTHGFVLVTSRNPGDLDAFTGAIDTVLGQRVAS